MLEGLDGGLGVEGLRLKGKESFKSEGSEHLAFWALLGATLNSKKQLDIVGVGAFSCNVRRVLHCWDKETCEPDKAVSKCVIFDSASIKRRTSSTLQP